MAKPRTGRLAKYARKRDFAVTPEPPARQRSSSRELIFCVQKHLARSLHYDLRLEHDGVLLSWAVPKGPSLNPKDRRLAARTEDHPLGYGEFEGVIPSGYGAGVVMLWDRGTWTPENGDVEQALRKGEIKFKLDGVKLRGSWVLVRTRNNDASAEQWLLIKHKDEWAGDLDVAAIAPLSVKSFGGYSEILRERGIPSDWRKAPPVRAGESGSLLREAINMARTPSPPAPAVRSSERRRIKLPVGALSHRAGKPRLTNLDKPLYPAGFTKGQLIDYYRRIAPLILPHLLGRAVTLKRYPDGVEGKAFFQKHCADHRPEWINTFRVGSDSGKVIEYCAIDNLSALTWVANLAALELHVPLALAAAPDTPTAMVFDLDPGAPAGLADCYRIARRVSSLLDQMKLRTFAKLSGKKGVHLLVPLNNPSITFDQTRAYARAIAQLLSRDDPKRVTSVMRKSDRAGKVFIDWSQNHRAKTTVCAYSVRADTQPGVSWPVDLADPPAAPPRADEVDVPARDPLAGVLTIRAALPRV